MNVFNKIMSDHPKRIKEEKSFNYVPFNNQNFMKPTNRNDEEMNKGIMTISNKINELNDVNKGIWDIIAQIKNQLKNIEQDTQKSLAKEKSDSQSAEKENFRRELYQLREANKQTEEQKRRYIPNFSLKKRSCGQSMSKLQDQIHDKDNDVFKHFSHYLKQQYRDSKPTQILNKTVNEVQQKSSVFSILSSKPQLQQKSIFEDNIKFGLAKPVPITQFHSLQPIDKIEIAEQTTQLKNFFRDSRIKGINDSQQDSEDQDKIMNFSRIVQQKPSVGRVKLGKKIHKNQTQKRSTNLREVMKKHNIKIWLKFYFRASKYTMKTLRKNQNKISQK